MDLVDTALTSSSFGANGVICLFKSSRISKSLKWRVLKLTVLNPAASIRIKHDIDNVVSRNLCILSKYKSVENCKQH